MLRRIPLRLGLPVVLSLALLPAAAFAQSEDAPSVAEVARRAREQKKTQAKPAKVITEDDVKPVARSNSATPAPPGQRQAAGTRTFEDPPGGIAADRERFHEHPAETVVPSLEYSIRPLVVRNAANQSHEFAG